jgi:hypothetical protein
MHKDRPERPRRDVQASGCAPLRREPLLRQTLYARMADRGGSLAPRKSGGKLPKAYRTTQRLLEEDVKERPGKIIT